MESLRTVLLYGALRRRFGREFRLAVSSPAEAVRALCVQVPGFEAFLRNEPYRYAVFYGRRNLSADELAFTGEQHDIRIVPRVSGSGGSMPGWLQVVTGVSLISHGLFSEVGAALVFSGAVQLMVPRPDIPDTSHADNKPSYAFGGAVNTVAQGNPVALGYGRRRVGGAIISAGIYAEDMQ